MEIDEFNQPIFSIKELLTAIYQGKVDKLNEALVNPDDTDYIKYLEFIRDNYLEDWPIPQPYIKNNVDIENFDRYNQDNWFMPDEYKNLDIESHLLSLCNSDIERDRVIQEIKLFEDRNMIVVLRYLKYLVDLMREKNILWGVGRGSSVASYCLYLLKVHRIDSIKYQLDIHEFLK